jgi:pimeloyl-ACP methyl ester carboxylesterase
VHTPRVTDLRWESDGGGDPAIVLLHEGAGSSVAWTSLRPQLSSLDRRVVTYDRRGVGRSPHDDVWTSAHFDDAVHDLCDLLDEVSNEPVDLLGHSDGGSIALLAAARHPERVRSVIVVDTHVCADPQTVAGLRELGAPSGWQERVRQRYEQQHGPDWLAVVSGWLRMWTDGTLADWDIRDDLRRITCPVLVVHDRGDQLSPVLHAEAIVRAVRGATVHWYDDGTHRPHLANKGRFIAEAADFWQSAANPG